MTNQNGATNSNTGHSLTQTPSINDRSRAASPIPPSSHQHQPQQEVIEIQPTACSTPNGQVHRNEYISDSERRNYGHSSSSNQAGYPPQQRNVNGYGQEGDGYQMSEKTGYAS